MHSIPSYLSGPNPMLLQPRKYVSQPIPSRPLMRLQQGTYVLTENPITRLQGTAVSLSRSIH